jgi:hypothetical protein
MTAVIDPSIFANTVKPSLWECPVWHYKTNFTEKFNQELLAELYEIASTFNEASSKQSLLDYDSPRLQELIRYKTKTITAVINQYLPEAQEAVVAPAKSWVNVNHAGERIELHAHPDASVACTYYIQAPDAGGAFYYADTGQVGEHKTEIKKITPGSGDLIFFPAYVLHGVETNQGRPRVNLTTSFTHELTENSQDRYMLKSYINSMLRIKDL